MPLSDTAITYFNGDWHDGNTPILGAADHAAWQGTMVFDGARFFEGVTPDLDRHCARIIDSAAAMGMRAPVTGADLVGLVHDGIRKLGTDQALYLRPMIWSADSLPTILEPDPDATRFCVCLEVLPMAQPGDMPITVSPYRRPRADMAVTDAKAGALYPNNARMLTEARLRGFKNALSLDPDGNVAETATANIFMVRDGVVMTPEPNGTFLNGITRQRIIKILRDDGLDVREEVLSVDDFRQADEIFTTGNAAKVLPVTGLDDRALQPGPVMKRAREAYWDFAHSRR